MIQGFDKTLQGLLDAAEEGALRGLDAAGHDLVGYARSYTGAYKPGVRATPERTDGRDASGRFRKKQRAPEGLREVHPGGWADVTGELAAGYAHAVTTPGRRTGVLTVTNETPHAAYLERNDYWVVTGLEASGRLQQTAEERVQQGIDAALAARVARAGRGGRP